MKVGLEGNNVQNYQGDGQVIETPSDADVSALDPAGVLNGDNVQMSELNNADDESGVNGVISEPELEEVDGEKAGKADLAALIAFLQLNTDKITASAQGKRLESLKSQLQIAHKTQLEKIQKSLDEAKKQEEAAKAQKWLGWLSAVFAVVAATVITLTTGGLAAGFAWAGAALAISSACMNQFGAAKSICKSISNFLREHTNLSKVEADAAAQGIYAGVELLLGFAVGFGGMRALAKAGGTLAVQGSQFLMKGVRIAKSAMAIGSPLTTVTNLVTSGVTTAFSYMAGKSQANATENQQYITKIQKMLEESQEDLEAILDRIMSNCSDMLALLESQTDTSYRITLEIGRQNA